MFAKGYTPSWYEEVFVIKKIKDTVPWTYVIINLNGKEILDLFTKKNWKKEIKKSSELKK